MHLSTETLKNLRNEKRWSQEVLAKVSGLSVRTIQRIEADGKASAESTLAIAAAFETTPNALQATSDSIDVNWTRSIIMKNLIALTFVIGAIGMFVWLCGEISSFLDWPSALYLFFFVYAVSIVSFGTSGMLQSLAGLKYLFTDEIQGGKKAVFLAQVYRAQRLFSYGAAFIGIVIGAIAIYNTTEELSNVLLSQAWAVNIVVLFTRLSSVKGFSGHWKPNWQPVIWQTNSRVTNSQVSRKHARLCGHVF